MRSAHSHNSESTSSRAATTAEPAGAEILQKQDLEVPSPDAPVSGLPPEYSLPPLPPYSPSFFGDEYNFGDPSSGMDWFGMSQPFFNRGVPHLRMGENSGVYEQWMQTYQFGQTLGLGADTSSWLSNTLTPTAINSALKGDYPTMGEQISYELGSSPIMLPIPGIHFKLEVGESNDPFEREADAVAEKVMKMDETFVQRKCQECEEEQKLQTKALVQRKSNEQFGGNEVAPWIENQIKSSRGSGSSLPCETQSFMESRMGSDFSNVKVHNGPPAVQMNKELGAKAFTVGSNIFFNEGEYRPESAEGKSLLAHELTHVVQQSGGNQNLQRACLPAADCSAPVAGSAVEFSASEDAAEAPARNRRSAMTLEQARRSSGHGGWAVQLQNFLDAEVGNSNFRTSNIEGIFVDQDMSSNTGAYITACDNFTPPITGASKPCMFVPGALNQEAYAYNHSTPATAPVIGGKSREVWHSQTLQTLVHEINHVVFDKQASFTPVDPSCPPSAVEFELGELNSILSEFPIIYRLYANASDQASRQRYQLELSNWFNWAITNPHESIQGALKAMRCRCECDHVDHFIHEVVDHTTRNWTDGEVNYLNAELSRTHWNLGWPIAPLAGAFQPPPTNLVP